VKVVDFGVAKAENRVEKTRTGAVKGKISYLSPEQCRGVPIDRRSDLFSLGVVLWEMLTTERLYRRGSDFDDMTAIVTEPPLAPSVLRPGLAPEVDALALRLLAKRPEERFQSAAELVEMIEDIAKRHGALLSTTGLGRFMREIFGEKKEPWFDLQSLRPDQSAAEGVTITSEPIPLAGLGALPVSPAGMAAPSAPLMGADPASVPDELPTVRARPRDMQAILALLPVVNQTVVLDEPEVIPGKPPAWATRVLQNPLPESTVNIHPPKSRLWIAGVLAVIAIAVAVSAAIVISIGERTERAAAIDAAVPLVPDAATKVIVQPIEERDAAVPVQVPADAAVIESTPADAAVAPVPDDGPRGKPPKVRPRPPKKDCAKDPMACQH
jgi:hypothetical protein